MKVYFVYFKAPARPKTDPTILPKSMQAALFGGKEKESAITVPPKVLRPYEAKILFVKEGMLPTGAYHNPKPHDHRAVSNRAHFVLTTDKTNHN